jgi:hypothetical protein
MTTKEMVHPVTTEEIAIRLHELCDKGQYEQAQEELYSEDAISIEPPHSQGLQSVKGLDEILKKGKSFQAMVEAVHSTHHTEPIIVGNHFAMGGTMDVTLKGMGRQKMEEIGIYEVKDGKIVKEQFFF